MSIFPGRKSNVTVIFFDIIYIYIIFINIYIYVKTRCISYTYICIISIVNRVFVLTYAILVRVPCYPTVLG